MKQHLLIFILTVFVTTLFAQNSTVTWSSDIKLKRQSGEIVLITADKTASYFLEDLAPFTIGLKGGVKIKKYDNSFNEVYTEDLSNDLKGKYFKRFLTFKDRLFIIAFTRENKDNQYVIYAAEINKMNGALSSGWKELATVFRDGKLTSHEFTFIPSADSSSMVLVANSSKVEQASYKVVVLDEQLKIISATDILMKFAKKIYELTDVLFTPDKKIIITGKEFAEIGGKYKDDITFTRLIIEQYNIAGKKEFDISTISTDRIMLSAKTILNGKGDIFVCAFYSTDAKTKIANGLIFNRINSTNGSVISSSEKEIGPALIGKFVDDPEDKGRLKVTDYNTESTNKTYAYLGNYRFKAVYINDDSSILLIAEKFKAEYFDRSFDSKIYTMHRFTSGDLMVTKIGSDGTIKFLNAIPKMQIEETFDYPGSYPLSTDFFYSLSNSSGFPKYSSFTALPYKNKLLFYYNDHIKNSTVTKPIQVATAVSNLYKSGGYELILDLENGNVVRKLLFENEKQPIALLRNGKATGYELFLLAFKDGDIGKSTIRIGKILVR
jgi:hypothetical protein